MDINCDMGESIGSSIVGNDEAIFPYITSCNIACGFHGGDPFHIQKTISNAIKYNVRIGAHPSYPDLEGFGRRKMVMNKSELKAALKYQIAALKGMVESEGAKLTYVKPHGALYNDAATNPFECRVIIEAMRSIDANLALMGLANSVMQEVAISHGINFIAEAFADRKYLPTGLLMPRKEVGSVIESPSVALRQVKSLIMDKSIVMNDGSIIPLDVDSICIHGDNPNAVTILVGIKDFLSK